MKPRILYVSSSRIPSEKAHGIAIARACESLAQAGAEIELIVPSRKNAFSGDMFDLYGVQNTFKVRRIPTIDITGPGRGKLPHYLLFLTFYLGVKIHLLFRSRTHTYIYTRDMFFIPLRMLGFSVVFECHRISDHRRMFFWLARRTQRIVVISNALKEAFLQSGISSEQILVAPSGVDLSTFNVEISKQEARLKLDLPIQGKIIAYTGNFTTMGQEKGLSDAINAVQLVPGAILVAVGGSDSDIELYARAARDAGVADRVILRGYEPQKTLAIYQKAADILIMPFPDMPHYRHHMSPVKMFEYMASGRPIVASDLPTIREVLNERNAVLVPPGDSRALAISLISLQGDPKKGEGIARQALSDAGAYTWQMRSKRILQHIQS